MARSFDQIYNELGSAFDPSAQLVQQQINAVPGTIDAGIAQADAKLTQANTNIVDGARRRGIGFSGIPIAEQAQYAATEYAPAIARMKSDGENRKVTLLEALNGMNRDRRTQAQGIFDNEQARDFQERQFQEQQRQFNEQQAAAAREAAASRASASLGAGAYLGGGGGGDTPRTRPGTAGDEQWAYNSVAKMLSTRDKNGLLADYEATARSAKNGNIGDLYKLQMYRAKRPDLFKAKYQWEGNYGF